MTVTEALVPAAAEPTPPMLELVGVRAAYGRIEVLHGVDLVVPRGTVVAWSSDQLAMWIRDPKGGLLRAIAKNPNLSFFYRDAKKRIAYELTGRARVVDRMEEAGLIQRVRPENDRRTILVVLTEAGAAMLRRARSYHRDGIDRHFAQHLTDADVKALTKALEKVSAHARPLRPGRIRS